MHEKFDDFLQSNWRNGAPLYPMLKRFVSNLNEWNRKVFGKLYHKKRERNRQKWRESNENLSKDVTLS